MNAILSTLCKEIYQLSSTSACILPYFWFFNFGLRRRQVPDHLLHQASPFASSLYIKYTSGAQGLPSLDLAQSGRRRIAATPTLHLAIRSNSFNSL